MKKKSKIPDYLLEKTIHDMSDNEKAAIIGYFRNGMKIEEIASTMGISVVYVEIILKSIKK